MNTIEEEDLVASVPEAIGNVLLIVDALLMMITMIVVMAAELRQETTHLHLLDDMKILTMHEALLHHHLEGMIPTPVATLMPDLEVHHLVDMVAMADMDMMIDVHIRLAYFGRMTQHSLR